MSWRTIVITTRCKLDLKMGYMVVRGEDTKRIFLDEIALLFIENPAVSFTGCLLEALVNKKIQIIFCNSKRTPIAEFIPYYGAYDSTRKIKQQYEWQRNSKGMIWTEIVSEKIRNQAKFLQLLHKENEADLLYSYIKQMEFYDITNREGHAAKVYFNALFGMGFTRSADNIINASLNYGYNIVLSAFNREIVSNGYLTQIGIFHDNVFNYFNLSCDLMEPFRILVDRLVWLSDFKVFESEEKHKLCDLLNQYVTINHTQQTLLNAIKIYTHSVFDALNDADVSKIKFYTFDEKL